MKREPLFHWKESDVGRRGLCLILQYALTKATEQQLLTASPGDFGVSAEEMRAYVLGRLPELEQVHVAQTGQSLSGKKMMGRLYNMFTIQPGGSRTRSSEHPAVHEDVAATWNVVSGAQTDMFAEQVEGGIQQR